MQNTASQHNLKYQDASLFIESLKKIENLLYMGGHRCVTYSDDGKKLYWCQKTECTDSDVLARLTEASERAGANAQKYRDFTRECDEIEALLFPPDQ